jgi:hypothetical protein
MVDTCSILGRRTVGAGDGKIALPCTGLLPWSAGIPTGWNSLYPPAIARLPHDGVDRSSAAPYAGILALVERVYRAVYYTLVDCSGAAAPSSRTLLHFEWDGPVRGGSVARRTANAGIRASSSVPVGGIRKRSHRHSNDRSWIERNVTGTAVRLEHGFACCGIRRRSLFCHGGGLPGIKPAILALGVTLHCQIVFRKGRPPEHHAGLQWVQFRAKGFFPCRKNLHKLLTDLNSAILPDIE